MKAKIYHNPRCSKSRATLALLEDRNIDHEVIEYLKTPPTTSELRAILQLLGGEIGALVRTGEPAFKDSGLSLEAGEDDLLELIAKQPIVLQRPIVVSGSGARIGRPPESVLELFA